MINGDFMKKLFILLFLFITPLVCAADFSLEKWPLYKDVKEVKTGLNSFSIDDEIFKNTQKDLRDLRVIDNKNREVPYKLLKSHSKSETQTFFPKMLNKSYAPGENSSAVLDFGVNNQGINFLEITTSSENFQTSARVYGSNTIGDWRVLADDIYIYDYTDNRGNMFYKRTSLNFPESIYQYLKIEIDDNIGKPIKIDKITGKRIKKENAKELRREVAFNKKTAGNNTELVIDLGQGGIPHSKITVGVGDKNFNRSLDIYASFNNENWRKVSGGYIFRYNTPKFNGENLVLDFSEINERYIKFIIYNYDNVPLDINKITIYSVYREIVFKAEAGGEYKVYYGNKDARWPVYDLDKYFQYLDLNNVKQVNLSDEKVNPILKMLDYDKGNPEKSEKIKNLMSISLVSASIILIILAAQFFRKKK